MAVTLNTQNDDGDVALANAYITTAFFDSYHTNRGNDYSAFDADEKKAAIIRATDYLDTRFDFRGVRFNGGIKAVGTLTATVNFLAAETVVIGDITYTFRASPVAAYDVQLGVTLALSLSNLAAAVMASGTAGVEYATGTVANVDAEAAATATTILAVAVAVGADGNDIATTETAASASWAATTLEEGADTSQATEWPRKAGTDVNLAFTTTLDVGGGLLDPVSLALADEATIYLVDPSGQDIIGIPVALKRACAEYAFRALTIPLFQDAPAPEGGRLTTSEAVRVDVIMQHKIFASPQSGAFVLPAFPAADLLLTRAGLIAAGRSLIR